MSPIGDFLKDFTPQVNEDGQGFEILEGNYKVVVNHLRPERNKEQVYDRYALELQVTDVLNGNGAAGRKLWRNYYKDKEDDMKKLVNDMFTAGITLDTSSDAAFEASFENAIQKPVYIRAFGGKVFKKVGETFEAVEGAGLKQKFVVKTEKEARTPKGSAGAKKSSNVPF